MYDKNHHIKYYFTSIKLHFSRFLKQLTNQCLKQRHSNIFVLIYFTEYLFSSLFFNFPKNVYSFNLNWGCVDHNWWHSSVSSGFVLRNCSWDQNRVNHMQDKQTSHSYPLCYVLALNLYFGIWVSPGMLRDRQVHHRRMSSQSVLCPSGPALGQLPSFHSLFCFCIYSLFLVIKLCLKLYAHL